MSNIKKIRQEIERLRRESGPEHFDFYELLDHFKEFIDSLQEEKPSGDLEEAAEKYAYRGIPDEMKSLVKPVADEVIKNFIAGVKWQKEHSFTPTQEQLDALDTVYKTHGADSACRHILLNLLNQLKEL